MNVRRGALIRVVKSNDAARLIASELRRPTGPVDVRYWQRIDALAARAIGNLQTVRMIALAELGIGCAVNTTEEQ